MIEVNSVLFMGLWELVLLLLAVDIIIIVRFIIRRRQEKTSIDRLVTIVQRDAERREKETRNLLEKKYGYSDEQLEKAVKEIIREEKRIYQMLANLFSTRDTAAIENLSINFEEAVAPYRALEISNLRGTNDAEGGGEESSSEVARLKELNQTLNEELRVTMNTLSRMLHEYSIMLSETGVDKTDPDAVAAVIAGDQSPEEEMSSVTTGDAAEESQPEIATEAPAEAAPQETDETVTGDAPKEEEGADNGDLDSAASLVSMFQEDDDEILADGTNTDTAEAAPEEPESLTESSESTEESLAHEIEGVLENQGADLSDIELDELETKPAEDTTADPTEELLAQAIGETLESHETPLPDAKELEIEVEKDSEESEIDPTEALLAQAIGETLESHETPLPDVKELEVEKDSEESEIDPTEALLAQAIGETLESHETPLPDFDEIMAEEVAEDEEPTDKQKDTEKQLTDEIEETLNSSSETISEEDIDSLLNDASDTK